jgi:hypothetical protein
MKTITTRNFCLLIAFSVLTIFFSCRKEITNDVKINDFQSLKSEFNQPAREYGTVPFFVWNGEITREDINMYMTGFKNAGCGGVFIHPRPGLITEYLSDDWFELYQYTVGKGKELDMDVWIYDENSYPSGFAGGHVPYLMPESYNQGQGLRMTKFDVLPDTADKYYLCLKDEGGSYRDITSSIPGEKGKNGKYLLFSKTFNGKSDWYGGFSYVDLLYPGVTEKFIDITMTGYEKYIGTEFGKTVPGTFTDEPQINSPGGIRWTPDLFDVFQKQWNYDLRTQLPSLYEKVGEWKKVRHNYTQTLLSLFIDRWAKPWYKYCEEKGLKFTGHYWEHEWPNMRPGGDNMAMYAWHHVPGIDMLFNQFNDSLAKAQFGNIRAVKELASVANQTGRSRTLSETFGGGGWDLTFTDMKRLGDWEYALGVNFMNQHLTYFTMAGARKYDYPPAFTYHEPWWNNYKYINDHYARLSMALSSGRQINDILILEPTTTAWLYDSYATKNNEVNQTGQSFQNFVTSLEKAQVEYDLGSENIIKDIGDVRKGYFVTGQCKYSRFVIPPMTENLDHSTFKLLRKFCSGGGKIIAFSRPSLVDGSENKELTDFFKKESGKIIIMDKLTPEIISEYFKNNEIEFLRTEGGMIFHHRRELSDGQVLFIANSSLREQSTGSISVKGADAIELNTLTGKMNRYENSQDGDRISMSFTIPPAGSLLLFISDIRMEGYPAAGKPKTMVQVPTASPVTVIKNEENALMIDFCDVQFGNELFTDLHTCTAADKIFKYHGFRNGNPWNTSVQFKRNIVDRDTFRTGSGFTATYNFMVKGNFDFNSFKAVVERPHLWTVSVNGNEVKPEEGKWWLDRSFAVFNIGNLVKTGNNTITLLTSPMKIHAEVEPVYITGDFTVEPAPKGWIIKAPPAKYALGTWREQGLPFYPWSITYSKDFRIDEPRGKYAVDLDSWAGTIAEVTVNGQAATVIAFPPYTTDVTSLIKPGINKIDVKVTGSLKNLLGPHHKNPAPGLASPGHWKNIAAYPAGIDYQMYDYGLFEDFVLYNGE